MPPASPEVHALARHDHPSLPPPDEPEVDTQPPAVGDTVADDVAGRRNLHLLIQLRWIAVFGQVATIAAVHYGGIRLPVAWMMAVLGCLIAFNVLSLLRGRWAARRVVNAELFVALLIDVGTLTAQLYLSGGAANPFVFLYLLQVALGAVLLRVRYLWAMVAITCLCFVGLTVHHRPLDLAADPQGGLTSPYVWGLLLCFALNAALLVIFIGRISRNLRTRDARLAALRQRAAEEEHIVRMGLLASGAAHELGTPLATLSVILGDWRRMAPFTKHPDLLQEIDEMQAQLKRCKGILTGILLAAGETRGEAPQHTSVGAFVDSLVAEWRAHRPGGAFDYDNRFGEDLPIVSDTALKQMICNVLDNAREASPHWVGLEVVHDGDALVLMVSDAGAGFPPEMLARLGKPYQSSKGQPGRGLGLFLSVNVARTLGGNITAANRPQGGAVVTMTLPLSAITLAEALPHGS